MKKKASLVKSLVLATLLLGSWVAANAATVNTVQAPSVKKSPPKMVTGWCCTGDKVFNTTKGVCREKKGHFSKTQKAAKTYCDLQRKGYCVINNKVLPMKKGDCLKKKGPFFARKAEADKAAHLKARLSVERVYLQSRTVFVHIRNRGKGRLKATDYARGGLMLKIGAKSQLWQLKQIDPKMLLNRPGGAVAFNTGIHLSQRSKVLVALTHVPGKMKKSVWLTPMITAKPGVSKAPATRLKRVTPQAMVSSKKPIRKALKTAPSPPTTSPPSGTYTERAVPTKWFPGVTIDYFNKAPAPGTILMRGPMDGGTAPDSDSITVEYGESITLHWKIKACNLYSISVLISGPGIAYDTGRIEDSDMQQYTTPDGCTYYRGERTITVHRSGSWILEAVGTPSHLRAFPSDVRATKRYDVNVPVPNLNIRKPEVNEDNMEITFFMDNDGSADITSRTFNVRFFIHDPTTNDLIYTDTFTTPTLDIPRGGRNVRLGSVSLDSQRDQLFSRNSVEIEVDVLSATAGDIPPQPTLEDRRRFIHTWTPKTFVINNALLGILSSMSSYDIRLNNYGGGYHPLVSNDCHINLTLMGTEANSGNFSLDPDYSPYVEEVLIAIAPNPIPIRQEVALYLNNIVASSNSASDLLFIRDGKLGIHLELPNSGSREIKTGFHNWGRHNHFRDDPVGDIDLGPFSIDVLLTPELRDGKISFGEVEVQVQDLSARVVGALDDLLNSSGIIRRFLRRTIRNTIVSQLKAIVDSNLARNAFEQGIANNLPGNITRILEISAVGDTITVRYL